jgi:hypothetical protein
VFDPHTRDRTVGRYRLLVLDGHGSHVTPEFDQYCLQNNIIVVCMPAHSSHLLQPLDVNCFAVLKRSYGRLVQEKMVLGVNHIDKQDFIPLYEQARTEALQSANIRSGFAATGLVPFNPDRVLSILNTQYRTPSPPPPVSATRVSPWAAETPHNLTELQNQTELIKRHINRVQQSPSTLRALDQLAKGCQIAMQQIALLAHENDRLFTENQRRKQRRKQQRRFVQHGGILTGAEGQDRVQMLENDNNTVSEQNQDGTQQRAPPRCSVCNSLGHNARRCPVRRSSD